MATTDGFTPIPEQYIKFSFTGGKVPTSPALWRLQDFNDDADGDFDNDGFDNKGYSLLESEEQDSRNHSRRSWMDQYRNRTTVRIPGEVTIPVERTCQIVFNIPTDMGAPVYMFYKLTNFYQNHRRYVLSFSESQLNGKPLTANELSGSGSCKPLVTNEAGIPYYPCGLIANSFFNDTFSALTSVNDIDFLDSTEAANTFWFPDGFGFYNSSGSPTDIRNGTFGRRGTRRRYNMTDEGIAWSTDKDRFKKTQYDPSAVVPPPNWVKMFPDGYTEENMPDISNWESLQNWMRTAGLPAFSKLARRNDNDPLTAGTYAMSVGLNFPVLIYNGSKSVVLSTRSVLGGRNPFLGIAYLVVAGVCFVVGVVFLVKHLVKPRRLGDDSYLSWNNEKADHAGHGKGGARSRPASAVGGGGVISTSATAGRGPDDGLHERR